MNKLEQNLLALVEPDRLRDLTLDLVKIPSPTGDCVAAAARYAQVLRDAGLEVEFSVADEYPQSPSVVARLRGARPGLTLQLDGHMDTIHTPHDPPAYRKGRVYGRGSNDMKAGLAMMAEVARILTASDVPLGGDLLITAHGLHEAPCGLGETLRLLIQKGHVGDAVICCEGSPNELPIIGKGLSIFEVGVYREGEVVHETVAAKGVPHPILVGQQLVQALLEKNAEFARTALPYDLGPETYFVGIFEAGDFYNRVPVDCRIVGTRRYAPEGTFAEVEREFREIATSIAEQTNTTIDVKIWRQRDGFHVDPESAVAVALRDAYERFHRRPLRLGGMKAVADSSIFIHDAGVPALQYGAGLGRAHADVEWIDLKDVVDTTKVMLMTVVNYLGVAD